MVLQSNYLLPSFETRYCPGRHNVWLARRAGLLAECEPGQPVLDPPRYPAPAPAPTPVRLAFELTALLILLCLVPALILLIHLTWPDSETT